MNKYKYILKSNIIISIVIILLIPIYFSWSEISSIKSVDDIIKFKPSDFFWSLGIPSIILFTLYSLFFAKEIHFHEDHLELYSPYRILGNKYKIFNYEDISKLELYNAPKYVGYTKLYYRSSDISVKITNENYHYSDNYMQEIITFLATKNIKVILKKKELGTLNPKT